MVSIQTITESSDKWLHGVLLSMSVILIFIHVCYTPGRGKIVPRK